MDSYNSKDGAEQYIKFISSESGKFKQEILPRYILPALGTNYNQSILDAGCGTGWLTAILSKKYNQAVGCDASEELINYAKRSFPLSKFVLCDVTKPLPFEPGSFDAVVANMSLHDLSDMPVALANFHAALKPQGKLVLTISNPYYSMPVGVWKRGAFGKLLLKKPHLLLRPYFYFKNQTERQFKWWDNIGSNFYTLPEYLNSATAAGFNLAQLTEIEAPEDSNKFGPQYQMYRFPLILLLKFIKK